MTRCVAVLAVTGAALIIGGCTSADTSPSVAISRVSVEGTTYDGSTPCTEWNRDESRSTGQPAREAWAAARLDREADPSRLEYLASQISGWCQARPALSVGNATTRIDSFLRMYAQDVRRCRMHHPHRADVCSWRIMEGYYYDP
jgi:hypothetical protein